MKKYSVRVYLHTFCDYEVEAENEEEAKEIAESLEYDMDDILDNMCQGDDTDVVEIKMKKYKVEGIDWDCLEEDRNKLPSSSIIEFDDEDCVIDALSDKYGWCVNSVKNIEEIK